MDIWQAGCSVLYMITGRRPWRHLCMDVDKSRATPSQAATTKKEYCQLVRQHTCLGGKEGRKKQARSNKQQDKATQHTHDSHFFNKKKELPHMYMYNMHIVKSCFFIVHYVRVHVLPQFSCLCCWYYIVHVHVHVHALSRV